jgi:hypothetical protein
MLKVGMYLPAGAGVEPEPCFVDNHEDISRELGGGMFDVVVESMGRPEDTQFVGFVRDEFMFDGSEYNYLATALFKRDIRGGCVVLWGVDDTGMIDGEIYDLPGHAYDFIREDLLQFVASSYDQSVMGALMIDTAVTEGALSEEWADALYADMDNLQDPEAVRRVAEKMKHVVSLFAEDEELRASLALVVIAEQLRNLDEEG